MSVNGNGNGTNRLVLGIVSGLSILGVGAAIRSEVNASNFTGRMEERMNSVERDVGSLEAEVDKFRDTVSDLDKITDKLADSVVEIKEVMKERKP